MSDEKIIVYGTTWCGDCRRARNFMDQHNITYQWVDIETDPSGREFVEKVNHGYRSVPTIVLSDGKILVEPPYSQLAAAFGVAIG
jgi:mycoredoxin